MVSFVNPKVHCIHGHAHAHAHTRASSQRRIDRCTKISMFNENGNLATYVQIVWDFRNKTITCTKFQNYILIFKQNIIESRMQCKKNQLNWVTMEKCYAPTPNKQQRSKLSTT